jgi:hypothetical protein
VERGFIGILYSECYLSGSQKQPANAMIKASERMPKDELLIFILTLATRNGDE